MWVTAGHWILLGVPGHTPAQVAGSLLLGLLLRREIPPNHQFNWTNSMKARRDKRVTLHLESDAMLLVQSFYVHEISMQTKPS